MQLRPQGKSEERSRSSLDSFRVRSTPRTDYSSYSVLPIRESPDAGRGGALTQQSPIVLDGTNRSRRQPAQVGLVGCANSGRPFGVGAFAEKSSLRTPHELGDVQKAPGSSSLTQRVGLTSRCMSRLPL